MDYKLALITQDRGFEKVMRSISNYFGYELTLYENCADFVKNFGGNKQGVVIVDASTCSQPRFMDLRMVLNEVPVWQVLYLPCTSKKTEVKEAVSLGIFGCLHKPVNEQEIRQMVQAALGI
jgi:FixJ family two-component response regulator